MKIGYPFFEFQFCIYYIQLGRDSIQIDSLKKMCVKLNKNIDGMFEDFLTNIILAKCKGDVSRHKLLQGPRAFLPRVLDYR
jgi:hypothetical protein